MRYQVTVRREIVLETTFIVTAENADMAADDASSLAERKAHIFVWTPAPHCRELFTAGRDDVQPAPLTAHAAGTREGERLLRLEKRENLRGLGPITEGMSHGNV